MSEDGGDPESVSWWTTALSRWRSLLVDLRQRIALWIWTSDGRVPGGGYPLAAAEEGQPPGVDVYDVYVRYSEGAQVRLRGACTRDRTRRLTGFMSVFEEPYYQILAAGGARLHVDTSEGPLTGQRVDVGVGIGVKDDSILLCQDRGEKSGAVS